MFVDTSKFLHDLEYDLKKNDKIFLALLIDKEYEEKMKKWLIQFCNSKELYKSGKKIKVISTEDITVEQNVSYDKMDIDKAFRLKKLYNMYEFSDKITLLYGEGRVGDIWNFVNTGVLTAEEAFEAILC